MAAQEYYSTHPGGAPQQGPLPATLSVPQPPPPQQQGPPPRPPQATPSVGQPLPYPMSDAPPPYQSYTEPQRPQSQPPPQQRIPQQNGPPQYQAYNPNPAQQNVNTHQYPPEKLSGPPPQQQQQRPSTLQNMYRPSDFTSSHPPQQQFPPPPQQQQQPPNGYFAPAGPGLGSLSQIPYDAPRPQRRSSTTGYPTANSPYRRDSRSRSRSRERRRRKHHDSGKYDSKPQNVQRQKSGAVNTFLGASGGAIIGDLIFPGLGTLGGALIGGVGGHEYTKKEKRPQSNTSGGGSRGYRRSGGSYGDAYYEEDYRRGRK